MISDIGFALSAGGYALLLLLLFTERKPGLAKYLLIIATAITAIWSLGHIQLLIGPLEINQLLLMDSVKQLVWLVFLLSCLKDNFTSLKQVLATPLSMVMLSLPAVAIVVPFFVALDITWLFLAQTMIALEVLILLELIYRQAGDSKWSYKPLVLFLGVANLFEFVTYANATMVEQLESIYIAARGYIYVCLLPFLVLAIRRIKYWGVDIFISREVVLHSSLLMVAGAYLFVMALAGYAVKYIGGEWGNTIQIVLIVMSIALLAAVFLSNSFRDKIKVFITKHFFANQFDYRIEWVKLTEALQASGNELSDVYQSALRGVIQAIDFDSGLLIKKTGRQHQVKASIAHVPLSEVEEDLLALFFPYFEQKQWIIDVEELRYKPFVYEGLKINHALLNECSFNIVLPFYRGSEFWGVAVLGSSKPTHSLNWEIRDYLSAVSAQVSSYVFHNEAGKEVAENAQFAAFNRMSAFVLHDLKNVLAQIDLILCNAEQHKDNPEFIADTFETLEHTKARMDKMLRQLTQKKEAQQTAQGLCVASEIIEKVIEKKCASLKPKPEIVVLNEKQLVIDEEKFGNVMYHLLSNAQQATGDSGFVKVEIDTSVDEKILLVKVIDNGEGMSEEFILNRLYKPFDTTKGNAGMGIGAYDAKSFVEKIGGRLDVQSELNKGTTFTLHLPLD